MLGLPRAWPRGPPPRGKVVKAPCTPLGSREVAGVYRLWASQPCLPPPFPHQRRQQPGAPPKLRFRAAAAPLIRAGVHVDGTCVLAMSYTRVGPNLELFKFPSLAMGLATSTRLTTTMTASLLTPTTMKGVSVLGVSPTTDTHCSVARLPPFFGPGLVDGLDFVGLDFVDPPLGHGVRYPQLSDCADGWPQAPFHGLEARFGDDRLALDRWAPVAFNWRLDSADLSASVGLRWPRWEFSRRSLGNEAPF